MFLYMKGYKYNRDKVIELVGAENAKQLFRAIKKDIPIIISEENSERLIDGELYRALKVLGAKKVYSRYLLLSNERKIHGVYCAFFNEYAPDNEYL